MFFHLVRNQIIPPVVTRFLCPPEIPLIISSPTMVSAQMSSPRICRFKSKEKQTNHELELGFLRNLYAIIESFMVLIPSMYNQWQHFPSDLLLLLPEILESNDENVNHHGSNFSTLRTFIDKRFWHSIKFTSKIDSSHSF